MLLNNLRLIQDLRLENKIIDIEYRGRRKNKCEVVDSPVMS